MNIFQMRSGHRENVRSAVDQCRREGLAAEITNVHALSPDYATLGNRPNSAAADCRERSAQPGGQKPGEPVQRPDVSPWIRYALFGVEQNDPVERPASNGPDSKRLKFALPLSAEHALARLGVLLKSDGQSIGRLMRGEPRAAVVGSIDGEHFRLQNSHAVPHLHDVRAFGRVTSVDQLRSAVTVEFRRSSASKWAIRLVWTLGLLLVSSALIAATQQPVFVIFATFTAVGASLLIWTTRERQDDRERLRAFIRDAFPEAAPISDEPPPSGGPL